jgi:hypothetical protein
VVPADNKRFARLVVAGAVIDALNDLNLRFPTASADQKAELERIRVVLKREPIRISRSVSTR